MFALVKINAFKVYRGKKTDFVCRVNTEMMA